MGKPVKILGIALNVALLVVALWPNGVLADPPQFIRYQAKLTDAAGVPLTGTHNLSFAIFDQVTAGGALWSEGPVAVNLASAGVDRLLGQVTPLTSAVLTAPTRWLEVTVDGTVLSPRQQLASVPFAMVTDRLGTMTLADVQADVDARIGTHAANPAAHHVKTTDATELISGTLAVARLADASVPATKLIDGAGSGLDSDMLDGLDSSRFCIGVSCDRTLQQIAILRWYEANQTGLSFPVGSNPRSLAFDGSSIWVANASSNTVTKLRASDGALLGTFGTGLFPSAVAFDGSSIWVVNGSSNTVTKLNPSNGISQGTFLVGTSPRGAAFDGSSIWVTNVSSNTVTKLRAADGALLGTFPVGASPFGIAFDGSSIWVANFGNSNVMKLRASDGALLRIFPVGSSPLGVAFDGSSIWVANRDSANVTKLRASDGALLGTFSVGIGPRSIVFDGSSIWVANAVSNTVTKLRAADGALLGTFKVGSTPFAAAFDGTSVWVANGVSNNVTKL